jgi:hypothetical protein
MTQGKSISVRALKRLQTLWGMYARRSLDVIGNDREARLMWAAALLKHPVESFSCLTPPDAKTLIDALQSEMGIPETSPARGTRTRERAHAAGTEGRKDRRAASVTIVGPTEIALIDDLMDQLGWDRVRLEGWLRSPSGPLGRRVEIRTLADANRVIWAMKNMVRKIAAAKAAQ